MNTFLKNLTFAFAFFVVMFVTTTTNSFAQGREGGGSEKPNDSRPKAQTRSAGNPLTPPPAPKEEPASGGYIKGKAANDVAERAFNAIGIGKDGREIVDNQAPSKPENKDNKDNKDNKGKDGKDSNDGKGTNDNKGSNDGKFDHGGKNN